MHNKPRHAVIRPIASSISGWGSGKCSDLMGRLPELIASRKNMAAAYFMNVTQPPDATLEKALTRTILLERCGIRPGWITPECFCFWRDSLTGRVWYSRARL